MVERRGGGAGQGDAAGPGEHDLDAIAQLKLDGADVGHDVGRPGRGRRDAASLDRLHRHGSAREAGVQDRAGFVGHRTKRSRRPKRRLGGAGGGLAHVGGEGIDDRAGVADGEVHVREFGVAGEPDPGERRPGGDRIAHLHPHAAAGDVAVLRLPAIPVVDDHAVAALLADDGRRARRPDRDVLHPIAQPRHATWGGGQHGDAGALGGHVEQADVDAVVRLIGPPPALVVAHARTRITIDVVLDLAGPADLAGKREGQRGRRGRSGAGDPEGGGQGKSGQQDSSHRDPPKPTDDSEKRRIEDSQAANSMPVRT